VTSSAPQRRRAFTLLELMVASAIAGMVLMAATMASTSLQQSFLRQRELAGLEERSELVEEYFAPFLRQVGQRSVRPWEAVQTSCAAPCIDAPVHWIEFRDGQHLTLNAVWDGSPSVVAIAAVDGECPLTAANGYQAGAQTVVLVPERTTLADGTFAPGWKDLRCTPSLATCTCTLAAMPGSPAPTDIGLTATSWGAARLIPAQTVTLRRDAVRNELVFDRDLDGDGLREAVRLADDVFATTMRFGHRDEVTGQIVYLPVLNAALPSSLRLLRLELAMGTGLNHPAAGVGVTLGGAPIAGVPGVVLRSTTTTVSLPTAVGL